MLRHCVLCLAPPERILHLEKQQIIQASKPTEWAPRSKIESSERHSERTTNTRRDFVSKGIKKLILTVYRRQWHR